MDRSWLIMTRQPTIHGRLLFPVAVNTKAHLKIRVPEPIHSLHGPMALAAINILLHMSFVIEEHILRQIVDLFPWNGGIGIEVCVFFPYLRMIGNDVLVTEQALLHSRNPGMGRSCRVGVTKQTLDLFYAGMHAVAEGYGLFRSHKDSRIGIKIKDKDRGQ